jgi:hypothetical protein
MGMGGVGLSRRGAHLLNVVEREVEPLEVGEVAEVLDLDDHVVVQVQLH